MSPAFPAAEAPSERPLRRDAERNRQKILKGAARVFAEEGLDVGMDELARRVGVGTGTLYRRFPTKDQLISALFDELIDQVVTEARAARDHEDPVQGLRQFLVAMNSHLASNQGLKELMLERTRDDERIDCAVAEIQPCLRGLVRRGVSEGALREDVTEGDVFLASTMIGAVIERTRDAAPDVWRRYVEVVIDGLRARGSELPAGLTPAQFDAVTAGGPPNA